MFHLTELVVTSCCRCIEYYLDMVSEIKTCVSYIFYFSMPNNLYGTVSKSNKMIHLSTIYSV